MKKIALIAALALLFGCGKKDENIKPNILWLTFEDTSPQYIGCYGNDDAHTPVMDKLASEGIRFTSAFSTGTVCSPSRYTLITGCRTTRFGTGHHRSNYPVPEAIEAFPKYLRDAGYYTTNNSKTDYSTSKHKYFTKTGWDESSNKAGWWNRQPGQPFFAVFNSIHSHQSRTMTNPWWKYKEQILDHLDPDKIIADDQFEIPPIYNDSPEMRKEISRIYNSIQLTDNHFGEILQRLTEEGLADSTIIFCFSDHGEGMPWGKCYSRAMGYRVPFIIWFPKMYKHLSPWGTGVVTSDVVDFADLPATVLSLAGIKIPEYMDGKPLLGIHARKAKKYTFGGLDRTGENTALSRSISDGSFIYTKDFMPFQPEFRWQKYWDYAQISQLIRKDFSEGNLNKIQSTILETRGSETFFNLQDDPWETHNLIGDKKYNPQVENFQKILKEDLISNRDAHFIPEYSLIKRGGIPYDLRQNDTFYPAKEVIETAFLCGEKESLHTLADKMDHSNDIVRYWAAVGIYSHFTLFGEEEIQPMKRPCLNNTNTNEYSEGSSIRPMKTNYIRMKEDSYPPADIFIQATKARFYQDKDGEQKLIGYIKSNNEQLGILTCQLLLLPETIEDGFLHQIIEACQESKVSLVKQSGELFEHKYLGKPLVYTHFW